MATAPVIAADEAFAVGVRRDHDEFLRIQRQHAELLDNMSMTSSPLFTASDSSSDETDYDATHRASLAATYNTTHAGATPANSNVNWWSPSEAESDDEGDAASANSIQAALDQTAGAALAHRATARASGWAASGGTAGSVIDMSGLDRQRARTNRWWI